MTPPVFETLQIPAPQFARATGWVAKPEGLCKDDRCVPSPVVDGVVDVRAFAVRMGMALAHDDASGLWALGPESGGSAIVSATNVDFELPDLEGRPFRLSSLRGRKVFLAAWATW